MHMNMYWVLYGVAVLVVSLLVGLHLGRFREAYTEMTGMMLGMTMGMLNGFLVGYAAAASIDSMFWGNLVGLTLGVLLGASYGRAGGLMGVMDGSMGGVMGGSMGAMLAVMLIFPTWMLNWTGVALGVIYILGIVGLVLLIEQSAPQHAALHRLLPVFTRTVREEAEEQLAVTDTDMGAEPDIAVADYYALLGVEDDASMQEIGNAYLLCLAATEAADLEMLEQAHSILFDIRRRRLYDALLLGDKAPSDSTNTTTYHLSPPKQSAISTVPAPHST